MEHITEFVNAPLQLNCGKWYCDQKGVYKLLPDKFNPEVLIPVYASYQQILPSGMIENIETGEQKYILSFSLRRTGAYLWKSIRVEPSICCSKTKIISLSNLGVMVNDNTSKHMVTYLADLFRLNQDTIPLKQSISHLGWIQKAFFPYETKLMFDGDSEQEKVVQAIHNAGSFEVWRTAAMKLRKNKTLRLMMNASLASVLLKKIGGLCFVVHFWGASGTGKTVGLLVSASIWGDPDLLLISVDGTINYFTNRAAFMGNLPMLIDEAQLNKGNLDKLIYSLAEGKTRGKLDRGSRELNNKTWENISVFTGEAPIVSNQSGAGAINRVLEIEVDEPLFQDFSGTLELIREHYGHAGERYIKVLQESNGKELKKEYQAICKELEAYDSTGKQIQNLAFLVLADRIAGRCIFEGEAPLQLKDITSILKTKEEVSTSERAYQFILGWIAANQNYFKEDSLKIYGKIEKNTCLFNQNELIKVLSENGYEFNAIKKEWADKRYLIKSSSNRYAHCTSIFGSPKAYFIKLKLVDLDLVNSDFIDNVQENLPFM